MLKLNSGWCVVVACVFVSALAAEPRPASPAPEGIAVHKGVGIAAGADNGFHACSSDKSYWLAGEHAVMLALRERYAKTAKAAGEHVYMELRGRIGPKLQQGASAQYDGILRVEEIVTVRTRAAGECGGKGR